jgi:hypothetical protein
MAVRITIGTRPMPALVWVLVVVDAASIGIFVAVLGGKPLGGIIAGPVAALLLRRLWWAHVMIVMTLPVPQAVPSARSLANRRRHGRRGRRPLCRW